MNLKPQMTPLAQSLPSTVPFVGPEAIERRRGRAFDARIGANENMFGPAPEALEAMRAAAAESWMYGDPEHVELRAALGQHLGIDAHNIVTGEGIDGLLGLLVRLYIAPGDVVVTSRGAYPTFNFHVEGHGGVLDFVPYKDDAEDPEALVARARELGAKMLYIANPDNPMGSWHDAQTIRRLIDAVPPETLLLLDEAYIEFAPEGTALPTDLIRSNLIRTRTFSKAYGMAGVRVGYAIAPEEMVQAFNKVRNHFGLPRPAQAGAIAALQDGEWLAQMCAKVEAGKARLAEIAAQNGLTTLPSATNFIALDCGRDGAFARRVLEALEAQDVFVRMPFAPPQNRCIRVTIGDDAALDHFAAALPKALAEAAK